ncbi:hypothetical protein S40285_07542 [Stachybotrys chlorohalonatus IBT 40285]|uniref:EKC/KEOPS complex subunit CGI121 n=1 Tax=Stachybotrys chlorohalonatus (strain IBT 40285) TaxID=1283841 RepID=A0A084QCY8_STAC4|nr:hypothetical protein S40285_07542 [Stachybotrys chlorohalonata IBT 40285]
MLLETLHLEHLPASYAVHIAMFCAVQNAAHLHQQLLDRNAQFEYAFVDASIVLSRRQLLSAVFKAASNSASGTLKTPNVHSEIVASLSSSNNIADAYRRYGISPTTKDLLVVKVVMAEDDQNTALTSEDVWNHLEQGVDGTAVPVSDENLATVTDLPKVRKYYKLNGLNWLDRQDDDGFKRQEMEMLILSSMAIRGV